jgi:hypothetical protein
MSKDKTEIPYGTLDLLLLRSLDSMGKLHAYALARRIEQVCGDSLQLSQGSIYPPLSASSKKVGSRRIGAYPRQSEGEVLLADESGRKQVAVEVAKWEKTAAMVARFLENPS